MTDTFLKTAKQRSGGQDDGGQGRGRNLERVTADIVE